MPPFFVAQDNSSLHAGAVRGGGGGRAKRARPGGKAPGWFCGHSPQNAAAPPRASTYAGAGAYPKREGGLDRSGPKRKKVANCHFFAMRYLQMSSRTAISAPSPRRGPILRIRV